MGGEPFDMFKLCVWVGRLMPGELFIAQRVQNRVVDENVSSLVEGVGKTARMLDSLGAFPL